MVGFVVVSHSQKLAEGVVELTKMMAEGVPIQAAGGLEDGSFGTSYERISSAVDAVYSPEGVVILMDMGSAVMTAEMVAEEQPDRQIVLADCPLVEGAVAGTVTALTGGSLEAVLETLKETRDYRKLEEA